MKIAVLDECMAEFLLVDSKLAVLLHFKVSADPFFLLEKTCRKIEEKEKSSF